MPRGKRKVKEPEVKSWEEPEVKEPIKQEVKEPRNFESKKKYSCGCPVVAVDATRNKEKCIQHQVS